MATWPYNTREWKQARAATLTRDNDQCQLRLPGCKGQARAADHIIDWRDGGHPYDLTNLQAACIPCNNSKRNTHIATLARTQRQAERTITHTRHW